MAFGSDHQGSQRAALSRSLRKSADVSDNVSTMLKKSFGLERVFPGIVKEYTVPFSGAGTTILETLAGIIPTVIFGGGGTPPNPPTGGPPHPEPEPPGGGGSESTGVDPGTDSTGVGGGTEKTSQSPGQPPPGSFTFIPPRGGGGGGWQQTSDASPASPGTSGTVSTGDSTSAGTSAGSSTGSTTGETSSTGSSAGSTPGEISSAGSSGGSSTGSSAGSSAGSSFHSSAGSSSGSGCPSFFESFPPVLVQTGGVTPGPIGGVPGWFPDAESDFISDLTGSTSCPSDAGLVFVLVLATHDTTLEDRIVVNATWGGRPFVVRAVQDNATLNRRVTILTMTEPDTGATEGLIVTFGGVVTAAFGVMFPIHQTMGASSALVNAVAGETDLNTTTPSLNITTTQPSSAIIGAGFTDAEGGRTYTFSGDAVTTFKGLGSLFGVQVDFLSSAAALALDFTIASGAGTDNTIMAAIALSE